MLRNGRVGGSGRLDLSLWTTPIRIQFRQAALFFNSLFEDGVRHGQNRLHGVVEALKGFRPFDHFRLRFAHPARMVARFSRHLLCEPLVSGCPSVFARAGHLHMLRMCAILDNNSVVLF